MGVGRVVITVMSGADDGKVFEFDKTLLVLGRHPDDDVYLPYDAKTSRHHARITKEGDSFFIEDTGPEGKGSVNGTRLNGQKIAAKTPLCSGDLFSLGDVWVKFGTR